MLGGVVLPQLGRLSEYLVTHRALDLWVLGMHHPCVPRPVTPTAESPRRVALVAPTGCTFRHSSSI